MGCNAENFRFRLLRSADFSAVFFHGQGVYLQTVQNYHKELPRLSGIIRVHSGRTERTSPITSERFSPQKPMQAHFPAGAAAAAAHSRPIKKLSPVSMRGNSQNGGQTTKSLLIKPQCSGVPIQQAVSLSSSFPRHCLLFVCAFFREMPESARSEELSLPTLLPCIQKPPRLPVVEIGAVCLLYGCFFSARVACFDIVKYFIIAVRHCTFIFCPLDQAPSHNLPDFSPTY